jgi:hypothetical protein
MCSEEKKSLSYEFVTARRHAEGRETSRNRDYVQTKLFLKEKKDREKARANERDKERKGEREGRGGIRRVKGGRVGQNPVVIHVP